jgi:hypothetical protein
MSIHIRVYPQVGSVGYNRTHRRRAVASAFNQARAVQLQGLRLQNQLQQQSAMYSINNTMPQSQYSRGYGSAYGSAYGSSYGSAFPAYAGYNQGFGAGLPQSQYGFGAPTQMNYTNQVGSYGGINNANAWQFCATPNAYINAQYGQGLIGGIGNFFANAFRGW